MNNTTSHRAYPKYNQRLTSAEISRPLADASGWMRVLGILSILMGIVILPLTVWLIIQSHWQHSMNIVIGLASIWQGMLLYSSGTAARVAHNHDNDYALVAALARLRTWFKIIGWLIIIQFLFHIIIPLLKHHLM